MRAKIAEKDDDAAVLKTALELVRRWWTAPPGATGEDARLEAAAEALAELLRQRR
jgi:hypothetical protein